MVDNLTFSLRNNQMTDVTVTVTDLRTNATVLDDTPLNVGASAAVTIAAGSDERGAAFWVFASADGSVSSNKRQDGIRDGDECTLG